MRVSISFAKLRFPIQLQLSIFQLGLRELDQAGWWAAGGRVAGRQAGRQAGRPGGQASRQAGEQASGQAGRQAGMQAGRPVGQAGRRAGRHIRPPYQLTINMCILEAAGSSLALPPALMASTSQCMHNVCISVGLPTSRCFVRQARPHTPLRGFAQPPA